MKRFFRRLSSKKRESNLHRSPDKACWPSTRSNSFLITDNRTNPKILDLQHNTKTATGQQEHGSTKTDSSNTWHTHAEPDQQATLPPFKSPQSMAHGDAAVPQLSCSREGMDLGSPSGTKLTTKLGGCSSPSDFARTSPKSPQHQLASIYRSYNDIDILSSGAFDFGQNQLLASAPDADWLYHVSDRLPDRLDTVTEQPQNLFSSRWEPQLTGTSSTQGQPMQQLNTIQPHSSHNAVQFSSPDESARFWTVPYNGPSPMAAGQGVTQSPASQRMVTPFAKYASLATSGPLLSADLDTAMPVSAQVPVQPHQNGSCSGQTSGKQHKQFHLQTLL